MPELQTGLRQMVFKIIIIVSVFIIGYMILGTMVCDLFFRGGGRRLASMTQFHNLKVAMSHYTSQFFDGEFPEDMEELTRILKEELGIMDLGDGRPIEGVITDAWGQELVLEGDISDYVIRSAGPDRIYETRDDIYIKGNQWGENVFDGSARRKVSLGSVRRRVNRLPFQDPTGYYEVHLPGAYKVIDEFSGGDSQILFQYSPDDFIRIAAGPDSTTWDPETEMQKRIEQIEEARDPDVIGMRLERYGPVSVQGGEGFEVRLEDSGRIIHEFWLVSGFYMRVRVSIQSKAGERKPIVDFLEQEIESRLIIH